jgi:photosystem II stability/assembly factor-like uncharacterized protein
MLVAVAVLASWTALPASAVAGLLPTPLSGWLWSTPTPQGNTLREVAFIGEDGYAGGEEGTMLRSSDGGQSWETVRLECSEGSPHIQELAPQTVVVDDCGLQESTNAGASFTPMNLDASGDNGIDQFSFLTPDSGFVEMWNGAVMWTEDGGAGFEARTPVPLGGASAGPMRFTAPSTGVAVINGKLTTAIVRTEDGGRSWHQVSEIGPELKAITFVTPSIGYLVGEKGTMLRTEDGGRIWQQMPLALPPAPLPPNLETISCGEPDTCLITATTPPGSVPSVIRTSDGGLTGAPVEVFPSGLATPTTEATAFGSPLDAVAVGGEGATALSSNAGATFAAPASARTELQNVFQQSRIRLGPSPLEAYIAAENGRIAATSDGGQQWRLLTRPTDENLIDVAFPTAKDGFALANDGSVYRTDDGGSTWSACGHQAQTAGSLLALSSRIVILTERNGIWRSTNGCARFRHVRQAISVHGRTRHLSGFNFTNSWDSSAERVGSTLIVLGEQILESTDEGQRWKLIPRPPASGPISSVSFLGARVGYVMLEGAVYFTHDGGRHWREINSLPYYESAEPSFISFSNVQDGFAVARYPTQESGNIIFRTEDAGASWTPEVVPAHMGSVTAADGIAYAAAETDWAIYVTQGSGLAGAPSQLTLAIDGPTTRPANYGGGVLLKGQLTPALAGTTIHLSWWNEGSWQSQELKTDAHGAFSLALAEPHASTWFVADWDGNANHRGAATPAVKLTVQPQHHADRRRRAREDSNL